MEEGTIISDFLLAIKLQHTSGFYALVGFLY